VTSTEPKSVRHQTTVHTDKGKTVVVYYKTAVVTFNDKEIILNTGGWWTSSTQDRMNWASKNFDLNYRIQRKGKAWYVNYQDKQQAFDAEKIRLDRETGEVTPVKATDKN
jgi:hypothetical protein